MINFRFVVVSLASVPRPGPILSTLWFGPLAKIVRDYWDDMSGGRVQLSLTEYPSLTLFINQDQLAKLTPAELIDAIKAEAKDRDKPFGDKEHLIAIMDVDNPQTNWGVTRTDPIVGAANVDAADLCHEMGHFFQHLNNVEGSHADTLPGFSLREYADPTCIMGAEHGPAGGKFSYKEPALVLAVPKGLDHEHEDTGPAMCPPMTVRTGWLDEGNPGAVVDISKLPDDVQLDPWAGAPPPGHAGPPSVATVDHHAPDGDRIYLSLRSPSRKSATGHRWDQGFPALKVDVERHRGSPPASQAIVVAQELLGKNGATVLLNRCLSVTGASMRLGRAPLRIDVLDGTPDSVRIRVDEEPWRNWAELEGPNGQLVHRVAAVARADLIDMFVIAQDGLVSTLPFRDNAWRQPWQQLTGAGFSLTAGMAVASSALDSMDLFVVGTDNQIRRHHCGPAGWDAAWPVIEGRNNVGNLSQHSGLAAAPNGRDRVELFASDQLGRVRHITVVGGAGKGDWDDAPDLPAAHAVAANTLADGVIQVHAVTGSGAGDLRLLSITWTNGEWDKIGWLSHGQIGLTDRAAIASVTPTSGRAHLIGGANPMLVRSFENGAWPAPGAVKTVDGLVGLGSDSSLAAVSRDPNSIDVAAVTDDHKLHVISASPDPNFAAANLQVKRPFEAMLIHGDRFVSALPFALSGELTLWNTQQVPGPAEKFTIHELEDVIDLVKGKQVTKTLVAVQAVNGKFVTAESGGRGKSWLNARADKIGDWEKFKLYTHPLYSNYQVFQALGGQHWRADGDGGGIVDCRGMDPLDWETFQIIKI